MSFFGSMFNEEDNEVVAINEGSGDDQQRACATRDGVVTPPRAVTPPPARPDHRLCGIVNRGATCYLNSLLQTLSMTPEFQSRLFQLGPEELGRLSDVGSGGTKVRIIPIQLQRLFARLMLLDVTAVGTDELTASFGWTNNEERDQHDIQELNRILFSAIEESLFGTPGQSLIHDLYHGMMVNQIRCSGCGKTSEREEDFLDICVSIAGSSGLEESLGRVFLEPEILDSSNQYRCGACNQLCDADKRTTIRHLPPILTFSILRFNFDPVKLERFKETGRFTFPMRLDMSAYCEADGRPTPVPAAAGESRNGIGSSILGNGVSPAEYGDVVRKNSSAAQVYGLFSVVVHRGGAHGGHYHALIRDVEGRGKWTEPEPEAAPSKKVSSAPKKSANPAPTEEILDCSSPQAVITAILLKHPSGIPLDTLSQEMTSRTGTSWRKRFKPQHGSLTDFLVENAGRFVYNDNARWVTLRMDAPDDNKKPQNSHACNGEIHENGDHPDELKTTSESIPEKSSEIIPTETEATGDPKDGLWFDFNDSNIYPIKKNAIEKQFSGKECAYMLFYRRVTDDSIWNRPLSLSDALMSEIEAENRDLRQKRIDYDEWANMITVEIHFSRLYESREGILIPQTGACYFMEHAVDRRSTVRELLDAISELGGELVEQQKVIHVARDLPVGGLHLYQEVTADLEASLASCGINQSTKLFIWDGNQVGGMKVPIGRESEPVSLRIEVADRDPFSLSINKTGTVGDLMAMIAERTGESLSGITVIRQAEKRRTSNSGCKLTMADYRKTIGEVGCQSNDRVVVAGIPNETSGNKKQNSAVATPSVSSTSQKSTFHVEDHVSGNGIVVVDIEAESGSSVEELKCLAMSSADVNFALSANVRLRVRFDELGIRGLGPPLHESSDLATAGLVDGSTLIMECGTPPRPEEITLTVSIKPNVDLEFSIDCRTTVQVFLEMVLKRAEIVDGEWHLCRADWSGDSGAVLDEPDQSVGDCHLSHGDRLFLRSGCPPPRGFLKVSVHLVASLVRPCWWDLSVDHRGMVVPEPVGTVLISKLATLIELKQQVMALDALCGFDIQSPHFVRLRTLSPTLQPGSVLRQHCQTLQKLKIANGGALGVEILAQDEDLGPNQMLLIVRRRVPGQRSYNDCAMELVWDTSQGAHYASLLRAIAESIGEDPSAICFAKHVPDRGQWTVISDIADSGPSKGKKRKKKRGPQSKTGGTPCDLRQAPFYIQDGDVIGVKVADELHGDDDDFATPEDDYVRHEIEQKRREVDAEREELKRAKTAGARANQNHRQEVAIKIHVDDFR